MRITNALLQQHIGNMFKRHWQIQGKRVVHKTEAFKLLKKTNVPIVSAIDLVVPKKAPVPEYIDTRYQDPEPALDSSHPLYKERVCHTLSDSNVLVQGMAQAQVLTKTLTVRHLPENVQKLVDSTDISDETDLYLKNAIVSAHLFDAQQVKLPKRKDPTRPMWNYPRDLGISAQRKNELITAKFLLECERLSGLSVVANRKIVNNVRFVVPFERDDNLFQFNMQAETAITTKEPLQIDTSALTGLESQTLPDLYPMKCNISFPTTHIYKSETVYPIFRKNPYAHLHTIFVHYVNEDVKHLHESPVTLDQFESRNLLKAFAAAACRARMLYGPDVKDLPSPINVQSVQVKGNEFYFGVYQLNTLNLDSGDGEKNLWFNIDTLKLYDDCNYLAARPRLNGYNPNVFKTIFAFYRNQ